MDSTWFQFQNHADKDAGWGPYMTCDIWINSGSGSDKNTTTPNAASLITSAASHSQIFITWHFHLLYLDFYDLEQVHYCILIFGTLHFNSRIGRTHEHGPAVFFLINRRCSIFRIGFSRSLSPKKAWTPHKESWIYVIQFLLTTCWIFRNLNNLYFLNRHIYI